MQADEGGGEAAAAVPAADGPAAGGVVLASLLIVLSGLVFGFVHPVGIAVMLAIAVLGGVFAWMAETRKSLVPSITAHFLNNFTSTLLLLFALVG